MTTRRRTEKRFFVDNAIIDEHGDDLGPYGLAIYIALCRHANIDTHQCFPSYGRLAKETGMGTTSVRKAVRKLKSLGLIRVESRYRGAGRQTSNLYTLRDTTRYPTPVSSGDRGSGATDTPPRYPQATTNNPNNEQSSTNIPPGGGKVENQGAAEPGRQREGEDLTPVTPLQRMVCQTFNRNGQFAHKTQKKEFLALERAYPDDYLSELMEWAKGKRFKAFVSAVKNPNNYKQWEERQAQLPQELKEI